MFEQNQPFKFNFSNDIDPSEEASHVEPQSDRTLPAQEVISTTQEAGDGRSIGGSGSAAPGYDVLTEEVEIFSNVRLLKGRLSSRASSQLLQEEGLADSDLIPGKYEGGFKLWECAVDLARCMCKHFRIEQFDHHSYPQLPGLPRVLELGCGQGIPGILLLKAGAEVHFQDYNREVLTALTAPNVAANIAGNSKQAEGHPFPRPRFFSGDWTTLPMLLESENLLGTYDMILSAETIYRLDSQQQLLNCIKQCLKPTTGQAWIAAKSYYFGVGGGTASFSRLVDKDATFNVETVDVINDGASNKREILMLTFRR